LQDQDLFYTKAIATAAKFSFKTLKYLIEEEHRSIVGRFPDQTVLQLLISFSQSMNTEQVAYVLSLVPDINETDSFGNTGKIFEVFGSKQK